MLDLHSKFGTLMLLNEENLQQNEKCFGLQCGQTFVECKVQTIKKKKTNKKKTHPIVEKY